MSSLEEQKDFEKKADDFLSLVETEYEKYSGCSISAEEYYSGYNQCSYSTMFDIIEEAEKISSLLKKISKNLNKNWRFEQHAAAKKATKMIWDLDGIVFRARQWLEDAGDRDNSNSDAGSDSKSFNGSDAVSDSDNASEK